MITKSGRRLSVSLTAASPSDCLGGDDVAVLLKHLLEIEADQRLILGDHNAERSLVHPLSVS